MTFLTTPQSNFRFLILMKFSTNFLKVNFRFQTQDKRDDKFNRPIEMSLKFKLKMLYLKRDFENIIRNLFPQQQQNCTFTSTPSTERYFNKIRFTDLPQWQRRGAMRSKAYTLKASTRSKKNHKIRQISCCGGENRTKSFWSARDEWTNSPVANDIPWKSLLAVKFSQFSV